MTFSDLSAQTTDMELDWSGWMFCRKQSELTRLAFRPRSPSSCGTPPPISSAAWCSRTSSTAGVAGRLQGATDTFATIFGEWSMHGAACGVTVDISR